MNAHHICLTIAGSDSSGGAGIQADLKTFAALACHGACALTAVTAQNSRGVRAVLPLDPRIVAEQIDAVFDDLAVDAVKVGMLAGAAVARVVAQRLRRHGPRHVVLDPVLFASTGRPLLEPAGLRVLVEELVPLATLVTPNLAEARALGPLGGAVLVTGGDAAGDEVVDVLTTPAGRREFRGPRIDTPHTHGTGCTLSSAVACFLARGLPLDAAVEQAIEFVRGAVRRGYAAGTGAGPVSQL